MYGVITCIFKELSVHNHVAGRCACICMADIDGFVFTFGNQTFHQGSLCFKPGPGPTSKVIDQLVVAAYFGTCWLDFGSQSWGQKRKC